MKDKFDIVEEAGIVIYDESDDYDPGEEEMAQSEPGGFRLMTNEEIFTDEYLQDFANKMDEQITRENRQQRLISIGVIAFVILFIGLVTSVCCRNIR